jgi:hypothetical protein
LTIAQVYVTWGLWRIKRRCFLAVYAFWETIPTHVSIITQVAHGGLTLNIGDALVEDLLENLGVVQLLLNLGDDGVGELALLPLLHLALVPDPRIQNGLGLVGNGGLLLQLKRLSLELGGFLRKVSHRPNGYTARRFHQGAVPWKRRRGSW